MNILRRNNVTVRGVEGPVLMYAHGFGCSQTMWEQVAVGFDDSHRQVLFDYVGSGRSDLSAFQPKRYATLAGYAQDVLEICDALGLDTGVTLVGHSVSSSIGLLASLARPGLFERLVLLGPSPRFLNDPPDYYGGFERDDLEGLLELMDQNHMGWAQQLGPLVAGGAGPVAAELSDSFCSTDPVAARIFAQATFFSDDRAMLPQITTPCLILQHRHDTLAPLQVGEYLRRHLAGSTLQILDVTGHCAHMSRPDLVVDAIRSYLDAPAAPP